MSDLARFQAAFTAALAEPGAGLSPWLDAADADRLAVYRNTVAKGCADAIAAQFPTVEAVVGEPWLRDAAVLFARAHPPAKPDLADYGGAFPGWLAAFAPAADMPWLADLARIDRARTEALFAADAPPLDPAALAGLAAEAYATHGLVPHPAARLLTFDAAVPSLWRALQAGPAEACLAAQPEAMLVARPGLVVDGHVLTPGAHVLAAALMAGESLAAAGAAALADQPGLDLARTFAHLIGAGAFTAVRNLSSGVSEGASAPYGP